MTTPRDLARVRALVELAADPRTPEHEAAAAAVQACRRIKAAGILEQRGVPIVGTAKASSQVIVQCALIVLKETPKSYRVAYASASSRSRGSPQAGWVPKRIVRHLSWMSPAQAREMYGTSLPVIVAVHVEARDVEVLERCVRTTDRYADEAVR